MFARTVNFKDFGDEIEASSVGLGNKVGGSGAEIARSGEIRHIVGHDGPVFVFGVMIELWV